MCKRFMVVIIVLGVLFAPSIAFADDFGGSDGGDFSDRVIYGPNVLDIQSGTYGVQVYAGNKFNAALCVLGFDGNDSRFTSDVKAYLSNETSGGSFYEFSNLFTNNNNPNFEGFGVGGISYTSSIGLNNTLYGSQFVWAAIYSDSLRAAAYARVEEVLDGNISGGSSGGTIEGDYVVFHGNTRFASYSANSTPKFHSTDNSLIYTNNVWYVQERYGGIRNDTDSNYDDYRLIPAQPTIKVHKDIVSNLMNYDSDLSHWYCYILFTSNNNVRVGCATGNSDIQMGTNSYVNNNEYIGTFKCTYYCETSYVSNVTSNVRLEGNTIIADFPTQYNRSVGGSYTFPNYTQNLYYGDGQGSVVPPTQWPEPDPVTPTEPPEVPSPTPTEPPIEPTTPQFGIPQLPNIGLTTEPTYQTADLTAVLDAMAKHCQHLQTCMTECFDSYYSAITQYEKSIQENQKEFLRSWFRVTLDTIRDCFDDLSDYLQRLFTWLADQMDFTFTGGDYDDSSILWWLKRIYSKLGSGTTVRPTDPVVDPKGIGDWFDQLIKNFVLDLLALGQDFLADVVEMFRQLTTKFPISIPWDIVAILTLFAAEPETPVLNIPQYALTGVNTISQVGTYVIDLQDYDGVMSVVRNVEKVVFAFWLCWKIDFFKQAFDIMTGGK